MKKMMMILAAVLMSAFASQAALLTWRGDVNGITSTAGTTQSGWSTIAMQQTSTGRTGGVQTVTIQDTTATTSINFFQYGLLGAGGASNSTGYVRTFTDNGSGLYDVYRDGFQFSGTNTGGRMVVGFSGLDNTKKYAVTLWSYDYSFPNSATQTFYNLTSGSEVSIGQVIMPSNSSAAGRPTTALDYSVTATQLSTDGSGNLVFSIWAGGTNEKLSGFQITEVVPEPATVGMLGLGALVTLLVRRMKR